MYLKLIQLISIAALSQAERSSTLRGKAETTDNNNDHYIYPSYCSTEKEIKTRVIPPLERKIENSTLRSKLVQVITVMRHGSRSPIKAEKCWEGYFDANTDTSTWDCNDKRSKKQAWSTLNTKHGRNRKRRLTTIEKSQEFQGTCELGELLKEGYDQVYGVGDILKEAYISTNSTSMQLFRNLDSKQISSEPYTYFMADNGHRTIMSGKSFAQSFLQHPKKMKLNIPRTINKDILAPSERKCLRLKQLKEDYYNSKDFLEKEKSNEVKELRQILKNELKSDVINLRDCIMTTYCTDRTLPEILNDFDGVEDDNSKSIFMRFIKYVSFF